MRPTFDPGVAPEDLASARAQVLQATRGLMVGLESGLGLSAGLAALVVSLVAGVEPLGWLVLGTALAAMVIGSPVILTINLLARRRGLAIGIETARQARLMRMEGERRVFENQLARGLEMAEEETDAFDVIRRAFASMVPEATVELLLADNSQAHLGRVVVTTSPDAPSGCPVDAPNRCSAARRAHALVFPDGEALDACPLLHERGPEPCTAVCVPVSIMGRTVGVVHAVRPARHGFTEAEAGVLQSIANQSGNRLGVLRMMSESQLQASTDGLTGLTNRRSFENMVRQLRASGTDFILVLADLDHFKDLNDTYGHEAGDRALRAFSQVLRDQVRADDIACRYGGEEFVLVLPGSDFSEAISVVERIRAAIAEVTAAGSAPAFTASFGIARSGDACDLDDLLQRADRALFDAKGAGRDCICLDGHRQPVSSLAGFS